ncbi:Rieske domain-containing protein isoform X2 [Acanthochromis polyacanthus]|uniref:Rieske domain-containing protein isoform X2 n=1 Tax=Acanthochromis polyacanthus TaxID=80966 RepID=UPI0022345747|nr:Rieske domain-containing protein isoform X2 [Acanthochromis polyacanthus]
MEENEQPTGGPYFVGKKDELIEAKRSFRTLEDRDILIIHHQGVFYALDSYCYHAGGLLQNGDIEHKYKITLAEGESLYKANDPRDPQPVPRWYSKGMKQRTHTVTEINGEVFVKLSKSQGWLESDFFQGEKGKLERAKAEAAEQKEKEKKKEKKKLENTK